MTAPTPLVVTEQLTKDFLEQGWWGRGRRVRAVDAVDLHIGREETLGLVGESGSGKTTVGRLLLRLIEPTSGHITFDGTPIGRLRRADLRTFRRRMQIVFQDPYASLNPRMRVGAAVGEPLEVHGLARGGAARARAVELLEEVGLDATVATRYPHELSGGQRQRVGIARALALRPEFLVLDEPVTALDVSVQAQVLHLLTALRQRHGLTYLFVAHDLAVVRHVAHRVAVMYLGRIVELSAVAQLYGSPRHPYTQALLAAIPTPDPSHARPRVTIRGEARSGAAPQGGCPFQPRCLHPAKDQKCATEPPALRAVDGDHLAACHYAEVSSPPARHLPSGDDA